MNKKKQIDQNGWLLLKNIFSHEEIAEFRKYALMDKDHKGDLLSSKLLSKVISDPRIMQIFKDCLASDEILYFGDSSLSIDSTGNGFHKDSKDREIKDSQEFKDVNYSLLRLGIYLQDHSQHSKGLCLRSGSHRFQSLSKGKIINVKSEVGDVIIWKLTTTHSANADVISWFPNLSFHPRIARRFPNFMKQKYERPRIALFMCFGKDDDYSKLYIEQLKTRKYAVNRWENSNYDNEIVTKLKMQNVLIQTPQLKDINRTQLSNEYKQL